MGVCTTPGGLYANSFAGMGSAHNNQEIAGSKMGIAWELYANPSAKEFIWGLCTKPKGLHGNHSEKRMDGFSGTNLSEKGTCMQVACKPI